MRYIENEALRRISFKEYFIKRLEQIELTPLEYDIWMKDRMYNGNTSQIGVKFNLSPSTVEKYLRTIKIKLELMDYLGKF